MKSWHILKKFWYSQVKSLKAHIFKSAQDQRLLISHPTRVWGACQSRVFGSKWTCEHL